MLETLVSSTFAGAGLYTSSSLGTTYKTDDKGNITETKLKPVGMTTAVGLASTTTVAPFENASSYNHTMDTVKNASAYVESMSDEQLIAALQALDMLDVENPEQIVNSRQI